jgi:hypothetical protein
MKMVTKNIKVKFIKDWGKYKKGQTAILGKAITTSLLEMGGIIELTDEIIQHFSYYYLLKKNGLNPIKNIFTRTEVATALINLEIKLTKKKKLRSITNQ